MFTSVPRIKSHLFGLAVLSIFLAAPSTVRAGGLNGDACAASCTKLYLKHMGKLASCVAKDITVADTTKTAACTAAALAKVGTAWHSKILKGCATPCATENYGLILNSIVPDPCDALFTDLLTAATGAGDTNAVTHYMAAKSGCGF